MTPYNLEFCNRFGYPAQIRDHFVEILDQICLHLGPENVKLVVLFGSTSRGELTYEVTEESRIELFSDYEFLIVTRRGVPQEKVAELSQSFINNKVRWGISNPLFHIEFMHNSVLKLRAKRLMVRNIPSFELFETGIVIYGEDRVWNKYKARITPQNMNMGNTNELIIERLWKQLQLLCGTTSAQTGDLQSEHVAKYFTARNALEILTIFLPNEGVLLPGYQARYAYFSEHYENGNPLPPTFHKFMRECLDAKLHLRVSKSFEYYYKEMLAGFLALTNWLIEGKSCEPPVLSDVPSFCRRLITTKNSIFREPILWRCNQVVRDYRVARRLKISRPIQWALWEKRPHALALLLYVHSWMLAQSQGRNLPDKYLSEAQRLLEQVQLKDRMNVPDWDEVVAQTQAILSPWRGSF